MTREEIIKLPKVELHCHLDGSLSREFVEKRLGKAGGKEELSVSNDCTSLAEYWKSLICRDNAYKMKKVLKKPVMMCLEV